MPKSARNKYYAVRVGREGPKVYNSWTECKEKVSRWPGAIYKSFTSLADAESWVANSIRPSHPCDPGACLPPSASASVMSQGEGKVSDPPPESRDTVDEGPLIKHGCEPLSSDIVLSDEQKQVLAMVQRGENVFFTGSAGTGKSVLLREIIRMRGGHASSTLAITASTGIASVNIGGTTVHSWAGIGLGQEAAKNLAGKFLGQKKFENVLNRWRSVQTLILDEISMIDGVLFDKLEFIARMLRRSEEPFGDIQLVLSGDFCQLPPVPDRGKDGTSIPSTFAFEAESWSRCIKRPVVLTRVFRQKEQTFVDMLNSMRLGDMDESAIQTFKSLSRPIYYDDGIGPTQIYPTRAEVDRANESQLHALSGQGYQYNATDTPGYDSNGMPVTIQQMERLLERLVAPRIILLKVGAQVMLIKNMIQGQLVNGSVGQVVRFSTSQEAMQDHTEIATEEGLRGSRPDVSWAVKSYNHTQWPVVRFTNGRELLCIPTDFTVDNAVGQMEARRRQVPLILAWALSVHKSQGQTLERVKVDLRRTFEKGQAYVALSRATNMKTLEILNFNPAKVMVHPRVLTWHRNLERERLSATPECDEDWLSDIDADEVW